MENKERTLVTRIRRALGNDQGCIHDLFRMVDRENIPRPLTPQFIVDALVELQKEIGQAEVQRGVVIVDTFRTAFVPDTNDEQEMLNILVPLKSLAQKTGWLVMVLHHNAKATNAYSGSTAIAGVADYLWNWTKNLNNLTNLLSQEGRGDYEEPQRFEYDPTLKTLVWTGTDAYHQEKAKESATEERIAKTLIAVPGDKFINSNELHDQTGLSKPTLSRRLFEATPYLEIQDDGPGKEKRYKRNPQAEELLRRRSAKLLLA